MITIFENVKGQQLIQISVLLMADFFFVFIYIKEMLGAEHFPICSYLAVIKGISSRCYNYEDVNLYSGTC